MLLHALPEPNLAILESSFNGRFNSNNSLSPKVSAAIPAAEEANPALMGNLALDSTLT
jgi:hypothetical protein